MEEILNDMKEIIVAVASTVIGTIVGWILGQINFGKVHVSITNFSEEYLYVEPGYMSIPGKRDNELYEAELLFKICLYNSSSINKAIRNCTLVFYDCANRLIMEKSVEDQSSRKQSGYGSSCDKVEIVNIPAHESADVKGIAWIGDIDLMYQVKKIKFRYEDAKFHKHYLKYKNIDFQKVPRFSMNIENGEK